MKFVTSFGPEGWDLYGKAFLESYVAHNHHPIDVYVEGESPEFEHDLVTFRDLLRVPGCMQFLKMAQFPAAQGHLMGQDRRNYRYDCFRFSRKCFAQIDAASRADGYLFWIDADVEFHGELNVPTGFQFMAYLGRPEWHSCASFVGWDMRHPVAGPFFKYYRELHISGTIFTLPEWHDSYVLDWLREKTEVPAQNLAEGLSLEGPANVFNEVFGYCASHKKGALKWAA
jgi:hypothetical protein